MRRKRKASRAKRSAFAERLVRLREERGCASAYAFFHDNGGKRKFGFTYQYYLLIERGLRLPGASCLDAIMETLALKDISLYAQRRELLGLYLRELAGGDEIFDVLFEKPEGAPSPDAKAGSSEDVLTATAKRKVTEIPRMSDEQYEAVNSSPAALWAFQLLLQTGQERGEEELSAELGVPHHELQFALGVLVEHKLIQKKKDHYHCKYFESDLFGPVSGIGAARAAWVSEQIQRRIQLQPAELSYPHFFMVAEDRSRIALLSQLLNEAMRKAYLLRPSRPVRGGTLVSVEARIGPLAKLGSG